MKQDLDYSIILCWSRHWSMLQEDYKAIIAYIMCLAMSYHPWERWFWALHWLVIKLVPLWVHPRQRPSPEPRPPSPAFSHILFTHFGEPARMLESIRSTPIA